MTKPRSPSTHEKVLEYIHEMNEDALFPTGYEKAVIGYVERFGMQPLVLLDKAKMIEMLVKEGF